MCFSCIKMRQLIKNMQYKIFLTKKTVMFPQPMHRWPLQPGGELGPGPSDRGGVHHQPWWAGLLWMPSWFQPPKQLRLDLQEPQRDRDHHRGPTTGGAALQTGPGWGVPVPSLQQCDEETGRDPVYSGGGQLGNRCVEGGEWLQGAVRGQVLVILFDKHRKQHFTPKAELLRFKRRGEDPYQWQGLSDF